MEALKALYPESDSDIADSDEDADPCDLLGLESASFNQSADEFQPKPLPDDLLAAVADVSIKSKKPAISSESSSDSEEDSDTASIRTSGTTTRSVISQADRRPPSPYDGFKRLSLETSAITKEDFTVTEAETFMKIGTIRTILDNIIVIESTPGSPPLDLHSVLFLENKVPLGRIFDVFGPVIRPCYSLRFESEEDFEHAPGLTVGADVLIVPADPHLTSYVFVKDLLKQKGTDASWEEDGEVPDELEEFSDDERERQAKQQKQRTKRPFQAVGDRGKGRHHPTAQPKPAMALPRPTGPFIRQQWRPEAFPPRAASVMPVGLYGMSVRHPQVPPAPIGHFSVAPQQFRVPSPLSPASAARPFFPLQSSSPVPETSYLAPIKPYGLNLSADFVTPALPGLAASAALVTDPKTLPSAEVLFYNPKNDMSLNQARQTSSIRSFLR